MNEGETEEPAKQIPAPARPGSAAKDAEFPEVASTKTAPDGENKTAPRA